MDKLTSQDIANLAGVSRSTVSRVVNGYENVPKKTYEHVMKVIEDYNYFPSYSGQILTGKPTNTIGLFWIGEKVAKDQMSKDFFMQIVDSANKHDYLVLSLILADISSKDSIYKIKQIFLDGRIDAGIFIGTSKKEPLIDELLRKNCIVGKFDGYEGTSNSDNLISVNFDKDVGRKSIQYLYSLGHTKIGIIDGNLDRTSCLHRHQGYLNEFLNLGLDLNPSWIMNGGIIPETGYIAGKRFIDQNKNNMPTAIAINNDACAFGFMKALQEFGFKIPSDVSIIGCDNHDYSQYIKPSLTTFDFDYVEMFDSLVSRVISKVSGESVPNFHYIDSKLIERDSCRKISF